VPRKASRWIWPGTCRREPGAAPGARGHDRARSEKNSQRPREVAALLAKAGAWRPSASARRWRWRRRAAARDPSGACCSPPCPSRWARSCA
jgi:hypothetical protein